jgi:hypothetical protein
MDDPIPGEPGKWGDCADRIERHEAEPVRRGL